MRAFWSTAVSLDREAADLAERKRFPYCDPSGLTDLATRAGLTSVRCEAVETQTVFSDFEDYWQPFTLGAGSAPGYSVSLPPERRETLRETLKASLPVEDDGSIRLVANAWAVEAAKI